MKLTLVCFLLLFITLTHAHAYEVSAHRAANESYSHARKRSLDISKISEFDFEDDSPDSIAKTYDESDFTQITTQWKWKSLVPNFNHVRDIRFLYGYRHEKFERRISWLYPDDGCWLRAALASQQYDNYGTKRPNKVFIFGNLTVKTKNSSSGSVSWWYHVAPIVLSNPGERYGEDLTDAYVLDPAIEPSEPLPLKDWILRQVPNLKDARIAFCNTYTYGPYSSCFSSEKSEEESAKTQIKSYLDYEWSRIVELKRNPEKELGDNPPWAN